MKAAIDDSNSAVGKREAEDRNSHIVITHVLAVLECAGEAHYMVPTSARGVGRGSSVYI